MEDIAAAVGITAGALYQHFRGKQDLLTAAVLAGAVDITDLVRSTSPDGLDAMLRGPLH